MMADRLELLKVFDDGTIEAFFPDHFNDMYQIQSLYSWKPGAFKVDTQGVLFHTLGPRSPELVEQANRLTNPNPANHLPSSTAPTTVICQRSNSGSLSRVDRDSLAACSRSLVGGHRCEF